MQFLSQKKSLAAFKEEGLLYISELQFEHFTLGNIKFSKYININISIYSAKIRTILFIIPNKNDSKLSIREVGFEPTTFPFQGEQSTRLPYSL